MSNSLGTIEKKMLGALISMSNDEGIVRCHLKDLSDRMGYKTHGGALTFAIQALEMKNRIAVLIPFVKGRNTEKAKIKVFL